MKTDQTAYTMFARLVGAVVDANVSEKVLKMLRKKQDSLLRTILSEEVTKKKERK